MHKPKPHNPPVSQKGLDQKLNFEIKRLVREKEDGIVKYVSKTAVLNGTSVLVFKNRAGEKVTLAYRLDDGGNLRFAREKQFAAVAPNEKQPLDTQIGRTSRNIL
jgi:hypothetical protein